MPPLLHHELGIVPCFTTQRHENKPRNNITKAHTYIERESRGDYKISANQKSWDVGTHIRHKLTFGIRNRERGLSLHWAAEMWRCVARGLRAPVASNDRSTPNHSLRSHISRFFSVCYNLLLSLEPILGFRFFFSSFYFFF